MSALEIIGGVVVLFVGILFIITVLALMLCMYRDRRRYGRKAQGKETRKRRKVAKEWENVTSIFRRKPR